MSLSGNQLNLRAVACHLPTAKRLTGEILSLPLSPKLAAYLSFASLKSISAMADQVRRGTKTKTWSISTGVFIRVILALMMPF